MKSFYALILLLSFNVSAYAESTTTQLPVVFIECLLEIPSSINKTDLKANMDTTFLEKTYFNILDSNKYYPKPISLALLSREVASYNLEYKLHEFRTQSKVIAIKSGGSLLGCKTEIYE
ncbi:MAG: hypothetical protein M9899_04520 [Bdellovibrionaceae bacterium]|nr:hypothetical protein [Pseudobdellovibrionaceae bacterium]